jgi:hypothetical protein
MLRNSVGRLALATVAAAAFGASALADPPAATISGNTQSYQDGSSRFALVRTPGTFTSTAAGPISVGSTVVTSLGGTGDLAGHPGASLQSQMSWNAGAGTTAQTYNTAVLDYYFEITGPAGQAQLLYDLSAAFSTSQLLRDERYGVGFSVEVGLKGANSIFDVIDLTGNASGDGTDPYAPDPLLASSYIVAAANPNGPHSTTADAADCPREGCSQSMELSGSASFQTNVIYDVHIYASTGLSVSQPGTDGSALIKEVVDPIFMIDPGGPNAGQYTLNFSQGVVADQGFPTGGVPEPATWGLMLAGFGALGAQLRRRPRSVGAET